MWSRHRRHPLVRRCQHRGTHRPGRPSGPGRIAPGADQGGGHGRPPAHAVQWRGDGQPGGGPFWVDDNGIISKQIIEKSQITMKGKQYSLMVQSTYFNPVMIVVSTQDLNGNKFDLQNYKDDSKFFIVRKKYKGQDVQFIELPGLWNGSMSNWNSLFIEIPTETFSPVKTVLDLLNDDHK